MKLENIIIEIKIVLDELNSRLKMTENRIRKVVDRSVDLPNFNDREKILKIRNNRD